MNYNHIRSVFIYGAGSWGTALGSYFSGIGKNTVIFSRDINVVFDINNNHRNKKYLKNLPLHPALTAVNDILQITQYDLIVLSISSDSFESVLDILVGLNISKDHKFLIATKGFCKNPVELISSRFCKKLNNDFAFITGPNLASEVVENKYSAATISSPQLSFAKFLSEVLSSNLFVMNYSHDIITMQIASILKNIFAIKSGILSYKSDWGENSAASLVVEYLSEIKKFSLSVGGGEQDFASYGVLGDLIVTTYSKNSRNYQFGYNAKVNNFDSHFIDNYPILVEGLNSLRIIRYFVPENISLPHVESLLKLFNF